MSAETRKNGLFRLVKLILRCLLPMKTSEVNTREGKNLFMDELDKRMNVYKTSTNKFRLTI